MDGRMMSLACEAEGGTTKEERKLMWTKGYTGGKQEKELGWIN